MDLLRSEKNETVYGRSLVGAMAEGTVGTFSGTLLSSVAWQRAADSGGSAAAGDGTMAVAMATLAAW